MAGSPDFVKLLDFSVAKLLEGDRMKTQAGVVFGTPQYMSPEQGRGAVLDARSDLYALGVLAFEMLTGNVPYNDENPMTVIQMHLHGQVPPMPDAVPYSVQNIVRRAMEKDAGRRYQSAGEMMQHCQQVFAELNSGNVAVGAGGAPRTVFAQNPQQMQGQPRRRGCNSNRSNQGGYVTVSAASEDDDGDGEPVRAGRTGAADDAAGNAARDARRSAGRDAEDDDRRHAAADGARRADDAAAARTGRLSRDAAGRLPAATATGLSATTTSGLSAARSTPRRARSE